MEILAIGGWLFWLAVLTVSIFIIACDNSDQKRSAVLATLVFLVVFGLPLLKLLKGVSVLYLFTFLAAYLFIGGIWSLLKWWLHCRRIHEQIRELGTATTIAEYQLTNIRSKLMVSQNKSKLMFYITFWPWSMLWSGLHDFIEGMYNWFKGWYESMTKGALADLDALKPK